MPEETPFDPCVSPPVSSYVRRLTGADEAICPLVHPADEMFLYNLRLQHGSREAAAILYFSKGQQIFRAVEDVIRWRFGGFAAAGSLLDFASGFGRSTRFLARVVGPSRLTVAEIDPRAVAFQSETFGVGGMLTTPDPGSFSPPRAFDGILAASFFSHLPARRFEDWLRRLYAALAPGGILIFSVHGPSLLGDPHADWSSGMVFRAESETARLEPSEYGTSYVSEDFVRAACARAAGAEARVIRKPFGLCASQDLYVLMRPPQPARPALELAEFPRGELDSSAIRDGTVEIEGWTEGSAGDPPPAVSLWFADTIREVSRAGGDPGARRRWRFSFPTAAVSPDDVVRVESESISGLANILGMGTLRPFLPTGASGF